MFRRSHRLTTTFFVVLSLLFSQLALSAYVCPAQVDGQAMAEMMAAGQPCEGMDAQQPALCHQHATDPGKNFEAVKLPVVSLPVILQVLQMPPVPEADAARRVPLTATREGQPPPDPLFLSTLRLRV